MSSNCRTDLKCPLCGSCCIDENISDYGGKGVDRMQADGGWAELQCGACKGLQTAGVGLEAEEHWIKIFNALGGKSGVDG